MSHSFPKYVTSAILFLFGSGSLKRDISGMYIVKFFLELGTIYFPSHHKVFMPLKLTCVHHTDL